MNPYHSQLWNKLDLLQIGHKSGGGGGRVWGVGGGWGGEAHPLCQNTQLL